MKKRPKLCDIQEIPLVENPEHIYNLLCEEGYNQINAGHDIFTLELHMNLNHGDQKVDGVTKFDESKILLEMSLNDSQARETIIHELIHVILEGIGLDERNFDGSTFFSSNEAITNSLAKQLMAIENLNPGLLSLIFDKKRYE